MQNAEYRFFAIPLIFLLSLAITLHLVAPASAQANANERQLIADLDKAYSEYLGIKHNKSLTRDQQTQAENKAWGEFTKKLEALQSVMSDTNIQKLMTQIEKRVAAAPPPQAGKPQQPPQNRQANNRCQQIKKMIATENARIKGKTNKGKILRKKIKGGIQPWIVDKSAMPTETGQRNAIAAINQHVGLMKAQTPWNSRELKTFQAGKNAYIVKHFTREYIAFKGYGPDATDKKEIARFARFLEIGHGYFNKVNRDKVVSIFQILENIGFKNSLQGWEFAEQLSGITLAKLNMEYKKNQRELFEVMMIGCDKWDVALAREYDTVRKLKSERLIDTEKKMVMLLGYSRTVAGRQALSYDKQLKETIDYRAKVLEPMQKNLLQPWLKYAFFRIWFDFASSAQLPSDPVHQRQALDKIKKQYETARDTLVKMSADYEKAAEKYRKLLLEFVNLRMKAGLEQAAKMKDFNPHIAGKIYENSFYAGFLTRKEHARFKAGGVGRYPMFGDIFGKAEYDMLMDAKSRQFFKKENGKRYEALNK